MEPGTSSEALDDGSSFDYELVSPIGYFDSSKCGYCGATGQSYSYYANATSLSPKFYQTLLNRCWRRSGKLMYRPNQRKSCCPHYTIRLDSDEFKPSRAQRQTINRFNKFVTGDSYAKEAARLYPKTREQAKKRDNDFNLIERVHEAETTQLQNPPEPAHRFVVTLEKADFTEEKYAVYDNYQKVVHKDDAENRTRRSFTRFLCSSPLRRQVMTGSDGRQRPLGSYHQCYRLDGKLVAIGVLDLLPDCVSSVYFLYDESIHKYTPGKLGALHEIALAAEKGYRWWYPGFYIHSCPKMRYKIDYSPQYILDPQALVWDPLDQDVLAKLDQKRFVSLSLEKKASSADNHEQSVVDDTTAVPSQVSGAEGGGENGAEDEGEEGEEENDSLFRSKMPGIPSISDMEGVDMDAVALRIAVAGPFYEASDLVEWESKSISDRSGIRAGIAELVAALGPDCVGSICLDLAPRGSG